MKIRFDIDCTPKEARELMGLPDLEPMQQEVLGEVEALVKKNLSLMDGQTLVRNWFAGWDNLQERWASALDFSGQRTSPKASRKAPSTDEG